MTDERFDQLLNGPLSHPLFPFRLTRLALALRAVVEATGATGELALEDYCHQRDEQDKRPDGDFPEIDQIARQERSQ